MATLLERALGLIVRRRADQNQLFEQRVREQVQTLLTDFGVQINPIVPVYPNMTDARAVKSGYAGNADVYSIVSKKIQMAANIPFYEYKIKGKEGQKALGEYKTLMNSGTMDEEKLFHAKRLKTKAMEQVQEDSAVNRILQKPNDEDSQYEFLEKVYGFLNLNGEAFVYKERLSMGANEGKPYSLNTLPSPYMQIIPDGMFPLGIAGYVYDLFGRMPLRRDEVMHVKYFNPDFTQGGDQLHGMSPLRAGWKLLQKDDAAIDSQIAMFKNGGPPLIIYKEDAKELTAEQAGIWKSRYYNETQGVDNKGKVMLASGKLGAIQTGLSAVDQDILNAARFTFEELCNLWKMPVGIYMNDRSSYNNQSTFEKMAYTHGIIPDVIRVRDMLNRQLLPDFGASGTYIDADFTNISALQMDMKTLSEWLEKSPEITLNERREMKMFERMKDANLDKIYVPSSWVPLDAVAAPEIEPDVNQLNDEGLNDYNR